MYYVQAAVAEASMNKLELETQTDETGNLQLRLPGRQAAYRVRVTVEWEETISSAMLASLLANPLAQGAFRTKIPG